VTGLRILRDIVAGRRDPQQLAQHRDPRCRASIAELVAALTGNYRPEHVFVLQQEALQNYGHVWGASYWDEEAGVRDAIEKLRAVRAAGIRTIVDPTAPGLGRGIPRIQRINAEVDLNIIVASGVYAFLELPNFLHYRPPEAIAELQNEAQHILSDLRDLAQGIHPTVLSDGGILEAVEDRCAHLPLDVSLQASERLRTMRFDDDVEGAAYFFVSEALANILKHSAASRVEVTLDAPGDRIELGVSDDGCGFNPNTDRGNGLTGLGDRIRALGGTLTISSKSEHGTSIQASIPTTRP